ncbi:zinc finger, CCHC-type containing protein, partial [Tanacetum coccineum]
GHKCSGQVFSLEVIGTDVEEDVDLLTNEGVGCVGKNVVHVLVDSGSTHNFLDLQIAKKLGCRLRKICPMDVSVANGNVMSSLYECKGFT